MSVDERLEVLEAKKDTIRSQLDEVQAVWMATPEGSHLRDTWGVTVDVLRERHKEVRARIMEQEGFVPGPPGEKSTGERSPLPASSMVKAAQALRCCQLY